MTRAFAAIVLTTCMGCGPRPTPQPIIEDGGIVRIDGGAVSVVEVGTGTNMFVPISDGAELPIIAGPQGGFHLWASVRVYPPMNPEDLHVRLRVVHEGVVLSDGDYRLNLVKRGDAFEWYAMTALIPEPARVAGSEVELSIDVTDSDGQTGSDTRRVVPQAP